jgi:hypothetical protein
MIKNNCINLKISLNTTIIFMDYYGLFTLLVGARGGNLPPYKDARLKRYKSVQKIMDLIITASKLAPSFPVRALSLDPFDQ